MAYLRNCWYCAGWSEDLAKGPIGRTILGQYLVFYRTEDGAAVALDGKCPHRFAPLDRGVVRGREIACPYHGLQFDPEGQCTLNPHGGPIPPRARLNAYPLVERNGTLWIWMGDRAKADPAMLPGDDWLTDAGFSARRTYVQVKAHYQLVIDNLLDLTHGQYLHPTTLTTSADEMGELRHEFRMEGEVIHSDYYFTGIARSELMKNLFPDKTGTMIAKMRWAPASTLNFDLSMEQSAGAGGQRVYMPSAHYLTPETEESTHYFAAIARDVNLDDEAEDEHMIGTVYKAFTEEDEPMIRACHELMGTTDLFALRPAILQTDAPAVQARRVLSDLLRREAAAAAEAPLRTAHMD